ncbi:MAG: AMP-binding protein [Alphaproteobacteria bacterium]|nr:AMP-binding protein [Alphaproteobacteria bacterium]
MAAVDNDTKPWIDGLTIGDVLRGTAKKHGDNDALVFPKLGLRLSYAQFDRVVDEVAKGLHAMGIRKGDHVAVWATNVPEWPQLQMATARIGAVLVTVNPAYRSSELAYVLKQGDIKALFLVKEFKTSNYYDILREVCPKLPSADYPKLQYVVSMHDTAPEGMVSWTEMLAAGGTVADGVIETIESTLKADEPINIQYTSGTTGFPKAAMLTHRNILMNGYYVTGCQDITANDRICIPVPYYHCFGLVMGTLGAMTRGAAMVVPAEYFGAKDTLDAIEKERATSIYGVPTMFIAMLDDASFAGRDLKSLRTGIMAGSPCPIEVMKRVMSDMGAREITIAYGQTESSPVITQTRTDDSIELRVETVGRALPGVEVKIVCPETGRTLGDGEQGELCSRGHGTMVGYYNNPEATAAAVEADTGWLHTGDIAMQYPGGYYSITGRIKDMVIRGGENIYPREIEEFLFTHPSIIQVSVVGVPDEKYGEELCAWIQVSGDTEITCEEIRDFCKGKLAHYKVPRYVKCVDAFPQTISGKIQKFKIRDHMVEELGLVIQRTA